MYPEVDMTIDHNFLGEGITGVKGVLISMKMDNANNVGMELDSV
ncbi:unnamed protein product [marine sediment metagenome]|uniref:Uncharacterized protein n=1 Tax=marine sediment metagenome TaxID=412755 RepID=X0ULE4_9ZZZZ